MMLSIRTQDRMQLVPYNYKIWINEKNEIWTQYTKLGKYETKERALEVLDEIEQHVVGKLLVSQSPTQNENNDMYSYVYNGYVNNENLQVVPTIYRMPKE